MYCTWSTNKKLLNVLYLEYKQEIMKWTVPRVQTRNYYRGCTLSKKKIIKGTAPTVKTRNYMY